MGAEMPLVGNFRDREEQKRNSRNSISLNVNMLYLKDDVPKICLFLVF